MRHDRLGQGSLPQEWDGRNRAHLDTNAEAPIVNDSGYAVLKRGTGGDSPPAGGI